MSNVNVNNKAGHPVAGIVLGIVGIAVALLMTLLFGVVAGVAAGVLGIGAVVLGYFARKNGNRGVGAIVAGALAIVLAFSLTIGSVNTLKAMKDMAQSSGVAPTFAKYMDNPYAGIAGVAANAAHDANSEETIKTIQKELEALKAYAEQKGNTKTAETKGESNCLSVESKTGVSLSIGG